MRPQRLSSSIPYRLIAPSLHTRCCHSRSVAMICILSARTRAHLCRSPTMRTPMPCRFDGPPSTDHARRAQGFTPLLFAAMQNESAAVELLVEKGANIQASNAVHACAAAACHNPHHPVPLLRVPFACPAQAISPQTNKPGPSGARPTTSARLPPLPPSGLTKFHSLCSIL